ncbi:hypothetical protein ACE0DR_02175 [Azotobacter sp. CWF10]
MKALPPALLLSFLGLAIADEAAAPTPASTLPPFLSGPLQRLPGSLQSAAYLPDPTSTPRIGLAAAAFTVGAAARYANLDTPGSGSPH